MQLFHPYLPLILNTPWSSSSGYFWCTKLSLFSSHSNTWYIHSFFHYHIPSIASFPSSCPNVLLKTFFPWIYYTYIFTSFLPNVMKILWGDKPKYPNTTELTHQIPVRASIPSSRTLQPYTKSSSHCTYDSVPVEVFQPQHSGHIRQAFL